MIDDPFDPPGFERFGGGHLFLFDLGRYLVRKGFIVTYVCRLNAADKPEIEEISQMCRIYRLRIGTTRELPPNEVIPLIDRLKREFGRLLCGLAILPEIIHTIYWMSGVVAMDSCSKFDIKHVHSILSLGRIKHMDGKMLDKAQTVRDRGEVLLFNKASDLITVCPDEKENLIRLYPELTNKNIHIIPYGIDERIFVSRPESPSDYVRRKTVGFKERDSNIV